jgi:FkbH-like protein
LPEVEVVDVPEDPALFVPTLEDGLYFETAVVHAADASRARQYQAEAERREARIKTDSADGYLESLEMIADTRPIDDDDMPRVVQLIGKTNQWNLTTRRHTEGDVRRLLGRDRSLGVSLRLRDRFGDYGLVGVVIAVPLTDTETPTLLIDTWLMSCRVIARTVEEHMMNRIAEAASDLGYQAIVGDFVPSAKNALVADLFPKFGFEAWSATGNDAGRFRLMLHDFVRPKSFVKSRK